MIRNFSLPLFLFAQSLGVKVISDLSSLIRNLSAEKISETQSVSLYEAVDIKREFKIMSRTIRNVIIFMDASGNSTVTPLKCGNSFMNRFSIDEDAAIEIIGIHHLKTWQSRKGSADLNMKIGKEMKNVF